jgi:hypothetical protein
MWVSLYWILASAMGTYALWSALRIADGRNTIRKLNADLLKWVESQPSHAYE